MVETVVLLTLVVVDETVLLLTVTGVVVVLVLVAVVVVVEQWRLTQFTEEFHQVQKKRTDWKTTMDRSQEFRRVIEMLGAPGRPAAQRPQPRGTCIITDSILSHIFCWHLAEKNFFLG